MGIKYRFTFAVKEIGRNEARIIFHERDPILTSKHFIQQYFMSFEMDPLLKRARESRQNGNQPLENGDLENRYLTLTMYHF